MVRTRKIKSFAAYVVLTALLLFLIEMALRATLFRCAQPEPNLCRFGIVSYHYNHGSGNGDLEPAQDGIWAFWPHRPYHVQINSQGLRNVEEVDMNSRLRILAIGDSFTFGPYVPNEDTWPAWLESTLRKRAAGEDVQVLNAGVPGYTIQDEYYYLVERGLALNPHLVILAFYTNDITDFRDLEREYLSRTPNLIAPDSVSERARAIFIRHEDNLAILQLISRIRRSDVAAQVVDRQREGGAAENSEEVMPIIGDEECNPYVDSSNWRADPCWAQFESWFHRLTSVFRDHDLPLLVVAIPDYTQISETERASLPGDHVSELAAEAQIPFLDLLPGLRIKGDMESLYLLRFDSRDGDLTGNAHMSAYGYRTVGQLIASEIERLGFLESSD